MDCLRDDFEVGRRLDNGRFMTVSPLNRGSFGMVLAAKDALTGDDVAIKCILKPGADATQTTCPAAIATDDRSEELEIHSRLTPHPNIVNLLHHFESEHYQYVVLELCNKGDLYEAIRLDKGPLETAHVRDFMLELVDAIDHLHSHGVYHRDIKPENIFLTSSGCMKLGDFGLATLETWSTEFAVGSDRYMAPEQFDASVYGYGYSPAAADIWALGIVLLNILFQRNPFATPTQNDPLFADFSRDRQSLFDVFPSMSQDTYNVLVHSMALDPANRSLAGVREALKAAVSFTIDDETLDEFCTSENDLVPIPTADREPLRTPSITSPSMSHGGDSFPWSNVLRTPQKSSSRQLSTIRDEDMDLFPGSDPSNWQYVDPDEASLSSNLDSGLGMSYKSSKSVESVQSLPSSNTRPTSTFVGSLPISFTRPAGSKTSPYNADTGFSKSWSDLWDEEEEERHSLHQRDSTEALNSGIGIEIERAGTAKPPSTPQLDTIKEDGRGSVTPRQGLMGLAALDGVRTASSKTSVPTANVEPPRSGSEQLQPQPQQLPKTLSSTILDKWAALGNFRRAKQAPEPVALTATAPVNATPMPNPTPARTKYSDAFASFAPFGGKKQKASPANPTVTATPTMASVPTPFGVSGKKDNQSRDRAPSWRQGSPQRLRTTSNNKSQVWQEDRNWREHKPPVPAGNGETVATKPVHVPGSNGKRTSPTNMVSKGQLMWRSNKVEKSFLDDVFDLGEMEWVGGWHE